MKGIEFDTSGNGLRSVLKEYQVIALKVIWENPEGLGSRRVWELVNEKLKPQTISRASVINFLDDMREIGVLNGDERTGKGGHRWIYNPVMDETEYKRFIALTLLRNLIRDFPDETKRALKDLD